MGEDHHDELIRFSDAALIVPRSVLSQAVDDKRLTLYRRKRTLLLAREQVMKQAHISTFTVTSDDESDPGEVLVEPMFSLNHPGG